MLSPFFYFWEMYLVILRGIELQKMKAPDIAGADWARLGRHGGQA